MMTRRRLSKRHGPKVRKWVEMPLPEPTPEQILTWLDQTREFLFEVWKKNPALRKRFEALRHTKSS